MNHNWASDTHFRLYLQGHNGRERQRIIDIAAVRIWDPIAVGDTIARASKTAAVAWWQRQARLDTR